MADQNTPILRLFREWQASWERSLRPELNDQEHKAEVDNNSRIEDELMALPSTCPADFIAKVIAYTCNGGFQLPDSLENPEFWEEAERLVSKRMTSDAA